MAVTVELAGETYGTCDCCGQRSRTVWGYASDAGGARAAYFVHWTVERVLDHGANFDLILGRWGEWAEPKDRVGVSLVYRLLDGAPSFMVVDADHRPFVSSGLLSRAMKRGEVVGTAMAQEAFDICDEVLRRDHRVEELLGGLQLDEAGQ